MMTLNAGYPSTVETIWGFCCSFIGFLAFEWGVFWLYRLNFGNECFATDYVLFSLLCKRLEPPVVYFWKFFFGHSLLFHSDFVYYLLQINFYLFGKLLNIDLGIIQAHWILKNLKKMDNSRTKDKGSGLKNYLQQIKSIWNNALKKIIQQRPSTGPSVYLSTVHRSFKRNGGCHS